MSTLKVSIEKIEKIEPHPNADRLDMATVLGWQCVVQKGLYKAGDKVVYIPIDSILPESLEAKIFGPDSKVKLNKHRVKTIKLRGAISQGLVVPLDICDLKDHPIGTDVTGVLDITKYEPPAPSFQGGSGPKSTSNKNPNPHFHKYTSIENIKNYPKLFEPDEEVVITEKIHGCLRSDTKIHMVDGSKKTIKEIVDNKINEKVLSIGTDGQLAEASIINWFNNGKTQDWKAVNYTRKRAGRGNHYGRVICTPNHQFWNPESKSYVACSDLQPGDAVSVIRSDIQIPYSQEQVLIGKMLGDGSLSNRSIAFGQKDQDYVKYTLSCLGSLAGNEQKSQTSGYGTTMFRGRSVSSYLIEDLFSDWFNGEKKQVPENIDLGPIALAFWYMDDGSLSHTDKQEDRISIATCGFDDQSVVNLVDALSKLNIDAVKYDSNGPRIRINAYSADKFFVLVSPYIPKFMQYKLPARYRGNDVYPISFNAEYKPTMVDQEVLSIEDVPQSIKDKMNVTRYDIETSTHNFIANGVVVHNSNFRAGWVPFNADTLWKKFKKAIGLAPKHEFVYGSHNVQLQNKFIDGGYHGNVYAETVDYYDLKKKLGPGQVVYGEVYGPGIQKGYHYGVKEGQTKLVIFDVMQDGKYLDHYGVRLLATLHCIDTPPIVYEGKFKGAKIEKLIGGASILCPQQKVREGVVVRPKEETRSYMGRKILKCINPEYLLGEQSEYH